MYCTPCSSPSDVGEPVAGRAVAEALLDDLDEQEVTPCQPPLCAPREHSLAFMAAGIAINATMFTDGEFQWFDSDHPVQRITDIMRDEFGDPDAGKHSTIVM